MSRCQRFDFKRISESQIVEQLRRICLDEQIEYDEAVLNYVVREADGSLRDAESLLDQVIAYSGKRISEKDVIDVIGVIQREAAFGIAKCIVEKDAKGGLELIARSLEEGNDVYQIYKGLLSFLRDMLMIKVWNGKPPFVFMDDREYEKTAELLKQVEYYEIQNMVHHMLKAEDLVRGVFPKVSLEVLFINLYNLSRLRDVEKMLGTAAGKEASEEKAAPEPARREAAPPRTGTPLPVFGHAQTPTRSHKEWPPPPDDEVSFDAGPSGEAVSLQSPPGDFKSYLKEQSKRLFGFFGSLDMRAEDDRIVVSLDADSSFVKSDAAVTGELAKHASAFFGHEMTVGFADASGARVDTLDDYVREAELLFKV
jgi:DNA polymerase-3 subunit gamma/tau